MLRPATAALAAWLSLSTCVTAADAQVPPQQVTLAQAIAIAAAKSPILEEARDDYRLAQVAVDLARAGRAPTVSVGALVQPSLPWSGSPFVNNGLNATVSQLVFDGGQVLAKISAAQYGQVAAAGTYKREAQRLAFSVALAYYTTLQNRATVVLTQQIVQQYRRQESLIQAQVAAGVASRLDLATAHAPTVRAQLQVVQAQSATDSAQAAFANVLGLPADAPVVPADDASASTLPQNEPLSYQAALARALLLRPDYQATQNTVSQAEATLRANRALRSAIVTAGAGAALTSTIGNGASFGSGFAGVNTVQLQLQLPVFDGGVARAQIAGAEINRDRARTVTSQAEIDIGLQVRQALATLAGARAARAQAEAELVQGRQLLADTQELYRAGRAQILQLLNAQTNLTQAENDRLTAIYALRQAEQAYIFALGER